MLHRKTIKLMVRKQYLKYIDLRCYKTQKAKNLVLKIVRI